MFPAVHLVPQIHIACLCVCFWPFFLFCFSAPPPDCLVATAVCKFYVLGYLERTPENGFSLLRHGQVGGPACGGGVHEDGQGLQSGGKRDFLFFLF